MALGSLYFAACMENILFHYTTLILFQLDCNLTFKIHSKTGFGAAVPFRGAVDISVSRKIGNLNFYPLLVGSYKTQAKV